jgi:hypothetical protein
MKEGTLLTNCTFSPFLGTLLTKENYPFEAAYAAFVLLKKKTSLPD